MNKKVEKVEKKAGEKKPELIKKDSSFKKTSMALSILMLYDFSSNIYSPIFIL